MSKTCATCRFWRESSDDDGKCKRRSPYIRDGLHFAEWPRTFNTDWCGEHQPREPEPEHPKAREPGWYWVNHAEPSDLGPWIAQWHGDAWWLGNVCVPDFVGEVLSPRLEPPT